MRVALLGAGRIGRLHARLLRDTPGIDEVIIADADAERAAEVAAETGITRRHLDRRHASTKADAIVIAAATIGPRELIRESIGRACRRSARSRWPRDLDATLALAADIDRSGIPFQLGFQRRFDAGYARGPPAAPRAASSARCMPSAWPATTRRRRTRPTSPSRVACSVTSRSTTSISFAG